MDERFALRYRQVAPNDQSQKQAKGPPASKGRRHTYLHDQRASDPLVEYLEDLESE